MRVTHLKSQGEQIASHKRVLGEEWERSNKTCLGDLKDNYWNTGGFRRSETIGDGGHRKLEIYKESQGWGFIEIKEV